MLPRKFKKGLQACNIIKKETPTLLFFCEICEIFKNRTPPLVASTCQTTLIALRESNNWLLAVNSFMTDYHIQASLFDSQSKSMDWVLYVKTLRHKWVNLRKKAVNCFCKQALSDRTLNTLSMLHSFIIWTRDASFNK